jgi:hypothetical protein
VVLSEMLRIFLEDLPSKGSGERGTAKKHGDSRSSFLGLVPKGHEKDHARKYASLAGTQEESEGSDTGEVGGSGNAATEGTEAEDKETEPSVGDVRQYCVLLIDSRCTCWA